MKILILRLLIVSLFFQANCVDRKSIRINTINNRENSNKFILSNDRRKITIVSKQGDVRVWDLLSGNFIETTKLDINYLFHFAVSPDGTKILTKSKSHTIQLWDINNKYSSKTFGNFNFYWVKPNYKFSPDGTKILSSSLSQGTCLLDVDTGELINKFSLKKTEGIDFSWDGLKVLMWNYDTLQVWSLGQNKPLKCFQLYKSKVNSAIFSPDGAKILTGGDDTIVKLWEIRTGKLLKSFKGLNEKILSLGLSEDGSKVLAGSGFVKNETKVWDVKTENSLLTLKGHKGDITFANYLNNKVIITGDRFATAKLWDAQNGQLICTLSFDFESKDAWVVTTPDGKYDANESGLRYLFYINHH